jgi:hypothetical protein
MTFFSHILGKKGYILLRLIEAISHNLLILNYYNFYYNVAWFLHT